MPPVFRNYTNIAGITDDYFKVRAFILNLGYSEFTYARWDWMVTHSYLDKTAVGKIGIWEENGEIVGIATFDTRPGVAFCLTNPDSRSLKAEMLYYAEEHLSTSDGFEIVIPDIDHYFQDIAARSGFFASQRKEPDSVFYIDRTSLDYKLPEGFRITTMKEYFDLSQYRRVLWRGFNHELRGEGLFNFSSDDKLSAQEEMLRPNVDLDLKVAVVSPEGNFVSYCGMWYEPAAGFALVEPVATDPDFRKLGLGKAPVLEGIRRVGLLGAKLAYVGSSQQFYYDIGFRPFATSTNWKKKD
jgi:GNAT superfamily N-acetyltransferase